MRLAVATLDTFHFFHLGEEVFFCFFFFVSLEHPEITNKARSLQRARVEPGASVCPPTVN